MKPARADTGGSVPAPGTAPENAPTGPAPRFMGRERFWLSVNRIEALTDGIFAISMTLLVLSITLPQVSPDNADEELRMVLSDNWHQFEHYALSFVLLASFWIIHHRQFHFVKRVNESFLWMNIVALMLVALVPFSTSFMSDYNSYQIPNLVFQANLMAIGLTYFCMWYYATDKNRLTDSKEMETVDLTLSRLINLVSPAISLVAMAITFVNPGVSEVAYVALPFTIALFRRKARRQARA